MMMPGRTTLFCLGAGAGLAGALALLNRALELDDLPPTLPGALHDWTWRGWRVRYTTLGAGPPMVLVHGVHAAASSFEMDKIFEPLANSHTVYALDLVGFGKSERQATAYSGALYGDLVADFLAEVVKQPAILVGSSLGSAYVVAAAARHRDLVRGLVLFSPTSQTGIGLGGQIFGALLRLPLIGTAAFNLLVSRTSIHRYLERVYANPALIDDASIDQQWTVSHQPNARLAPAAFIAGRLDLPFEASYGRVRAPMLVIRGDHPGLGPETPDSDLERLGGEVTSRRLVEVGQTPHQEEPANVIGLINGWLAHLDPRT
jgi:pimeloyl-ACP methyl ester carboxylesterase